MNGARPPELLLDLLLVRQNTSVLFAETSVRESGVNAGIGTSGESPDDPLKTPQATQESLMFLKPAQLAKGEHVLHIIDFIHKLVPTSDERTISEVGLTKLLVSYGPNKPKVENDTFSQWVIGNTRIFFTFLQLSTLASAPNVQHYLAFTVKMMELSSRFT